MPKTVFRGSFVATVTPFDRKGNLDLEGLERLMERHLKAETDGIIVLGSAGEAWTLRPEERERVVSTVVEAVGGKIPVVAGVTRVSTEEAVEAAKEMENLGVDAVMAAAPPYIVPSQEGLYRHFEAICSAVGVGVVLYNVPYRTGVSVEPEIIVRLYEDAGLAAYKEAGKNLSQLIRVMELTRGRLPTLVCDAPIYGLIMPALALGARGTANISGNVAPRKLALLSRPWDSWEKVEEARKLYFKLLPLMRLVYRETNPVALKAVMNILGLPAGNVRPPLQPMTGAKMEEVRKALEEMGLIRELAAEP